ncbi:adenine nucleotide alpha hydrolases-like protein [Exidia glandulosa HHB12029]|uniref:Adenine nucleotide alpha hydrolases-like protein n=1 Tax=Exidia glandulosa HHB12029 TaxID=1314781 RepID=A0A165GZI4_EXIGL|nr:adenine nucleotide alpha hydrolases-like protein [Exidia glandulosa HHB12029]
MEPDPFGEGVNIVIPAKTEPFFETRRTRRGHGRKASKSSIGHGGLDHPHQLPLVTGRPHFQRDRCSVRLVQGDFHASGRRYVVASDRSEESRYAIEWAISTVLRDGDELFIVTVVETDSKLDPASGAQPADRVLKLRNQQERQTLAFLLAKMATGLLQRTRLQVAITCQAWHAKNSRHMLLDIVDYYEPIMLIVGSRGVGQLKGILLGSTAHYLIQKSSVPVMVARRKLKRTVIRGTAHLAPHRVPRVPLAQAAIDKAGPGRDKDVADMRQALEREEEEELARRDSGADPDADADNDDDDDEDEDEDGKVAG